MAKKTLRVCKFGHRYHKSSDCPTCPECEALRRPENGFQSLLSAPARRAMEANGVQTLKQLSNYSEKEILEWHGVGPSSLPILGAALKAERLSFRK